MQVPEIILVALGGGVGSALRWLMGKLFSAWSNAVPWSTVLINLTGAFAIGYLSVLFSVEWQDRYGNVLNAAVLTGLLGGYTTSSTMQLDAARLMKSRSSVAAVTYLAGSTVFGIAAAGLGALLARAAG